MARLIANVYVADASGTVHGFHPGDDVPPWAVKAITNPKVWADEPPAPEKVRAVETRKPLPPPQQRRR